MADKPKCSWCISSVVQYKCEGNDAYYCSHRCQELAWIDGKHYLTCASMAKANQVPDIVYEEISPAEIGSGLELFKKKTEMPQKGNYIIISPKLVNYTDSTLRYISSTTTNKISAHITYSSINSHQGTEMMAINSNVFMPANQFSYKNSESSGMLLEFLTNDPKKASFLIDHPLSMPVLIITIEELHDQSMEFRFTGYVKCASGTGLMEIESYRKDLKSVYVVITFNRNEIKDPQHVRAIDETGDTEWPVEIKLEKIAIFIPNK